MRRIPLAPHDLTEAITPVRDLFVLSHLGARRAVAPAAWTLQIGGMVARPLCLSLADLAAMPQVSTDAVHQCAGNPLAPTVPTRRVACVHWGGVRLGDVLARAAPTAGAAFVWSDGADSGSFAGELVGCYRKDLQLASVAAQGALLATHLNGAPLPPDHGGPLRLVVPGFYGTNSVKWLWRLTLADCRVDGIFTTRFYNDPGAADGLPRPVWVLAPEAVFVAPAPGARVGGSVPLHGWAWSDAPVLRVAISADAGVTWADAHLAPRAERGWQAWTATWAPPCPGPYRLLCRATDATGATQPLDGARNAVHGVDVLVAG